MDKRRYKVLFLASWYPNRFYPMSGIFTKRHAQAVAKFCDVIVLYVVRDVNLKKKTYEIDCSNEEDGLSTVRVYYKSPQSRVAIARQLVTYFRFLKGGWLGLKRIDRKFGRPDIVHVNIAMPAGLFALILKFFKGIPYIITEHASYYTDWHGEFRGFPFHVRLATRLVYRYANAVSAVSRHLMEALKKQKLVDQECFVVPNVVPVPERQPFQKQKESRIRILSVSVLFDRQKNIGGLIRAFEKVIQKHDDVELHLVGDGEDREKLESFARDLGLLNRSIFFHDYVPNDELAKYFAQSNFFVLNSNYETFSVAAAEAIAHGIPVLVSKCGGPEEFVTEEVGRLFERQNETSLVEGMEYMIQNWSRYDPEKLSLYATEKFSFEGIGRAFQAIYFMANHKNIFKMTLLKIGSKELQQYQDILIQADYRLHEQVAMELLKKRLPPAAILDFGCGEGALSQRLSDLGFDVLSVDRDEISFKAHSKFEGFDFHDFRLMNSFRKRYFKKFDVALSVEVLEHLENVNLYLDVVSDVLSDDGLLIFSTPNIASWYSRMRFLYNGTLGQFSEDDLRGTGHINPITIPEITSLLERRGFRILSMRAAGFLPKLWLKGRLPSVLANWTGFLLSPLMRGFKEGWCLLITARKSHG